MSKVTIGIPFFQGHGTIDACLTGLSDAIDTVVAEVLIYVSYHDANDLKRLLLQVKKFGALDLRIIDGGRPTGVESALFTLIENATGEWIWLLSCDDVPTNASLTCLSLDLEDSADIIVGQTLQGDSCASPLFYRSNFYGITPQTYFYYSFPNEKTEFLSRAKSTDALFSCISNVLFRKNIYHSVSPSTYRKFIGTNFAHSIAILALLNYPVKLLITGFPLIVKRGGLDSFSKNGLIDRALMSYRTYGSQSIECFSEKEFRFLKRAVDFEWPWYRCLRILQENIAEEIKREFIERRFGIKNKALYKLIFLVSTISVSRHVFPLLITLKRYVVKTY